MDKLQKLKEIISQYNSAVIGYSGGVDSVFLAKVASEVLGDKVLLVTSKSPGFPKDELNESVQFAKDMGIKQEIIITNEMSEPGYYNNSPDRCYHCKSHLFTDITKIANDKGYEVVFDGSNADDLSDYRPGRKALKKLGISSPLCEAGLTKKEIREYSKQYNLKTATKPAFACLGSRFPYGERITEEKLERLDRCEYEIKKLGYTQFRVRSHENLARIEFISEEMDRAWKEKETINNICKDAGFSFVTFDLQGYRMGAMNEVFNIT